MKTLHEQLLTVQLKKSDFDKACKEALALAKNIAQTLEGYLEEYDSENCVIGVSFEKYQFDGRSNQHYYKFEMRVIKE